MFNLCRVGWLGSKVMPATCLGGLQCGEKQRQSVGVSFLGRWSRFCGPLDLELSSCFDSRHLDLLYQRQRHKRLLEIPMVNTVHPSLPTWFGEKCFLQPRKLHSRREESSDTQLTTWTHSRLPSLQPSSNGSTPTKAAPSKRSPAHETRFVML